jgi:hypothetical protein
MTPTWIITVLIALPQPAAKPVGMIIAVKGKVTIQSKKGKPKQVRVMRLLSVGDKLSTGKGSETTLVFFASKYRERLSANRKATVAAKGCVPRKAVVRKETRRLVIRGAREFGKNKISGGGAVVIFRDLGLPEQIPPVAAMFGSVVLSQKPAFSWKALSGATSYQVKCETSSGNPHWSVVTQTNRLAYPESKKLLERGSTYSWTVTAMLPKGDKKLVGQSKLTIANELDLEDVATLKPMSTSDDPADLLLAAIVFHKLRMYEQALAIFERLAKQLPAEPAYHVSLASYYKRAGRPDDAKAQLKKAAALDGKSPQERPSDALPHAQRQSPLSVKAAQ